MKPSCTDLHAKKVKIIKVPFDNLIYNSITKLFSYEISDCNITGHFITLHA